MTTARKPRWVEYDEQGGWQRQPTTFRQAVSADGSSGFRAEPGRYHLYVSLACPWAHRTIIVRALKRLEDVVTLSVVDPIRDERGWAFREGRGYGPDPVNGFHFLRDAYEATEPGYEGRVSVPVLWDRQEGRIVCNESAEIVRMLNAEFAAYAEPTPDRYPPGLREEIDALNDVVYENVNNGVYRAGFAGRQGAYEDAVRRLFGTLDGLEERLSGQRWLLGARLTEADIRLFTTLVRFDPVYHTHFKCNIRRLIDYPSLWGFTRDLYAIPGVEETVDLDHIKRHYYMTHPQLNPKRIVPLGPDIDYEAPHDRARLG